MDVNVYMKNMNVIMVVMLIMDCVLQHQVILDLWMTQDQVVVI